MEPYLHSYHGNNTEMINLILRIHVAILNLLLCSVCSIISVLRNSEDQVNHFCIMTMVWMKVWLHSYGMVWLWFGITIVWYDSIHMVWLWYGIIMVWYDSIPTIPMWYGIPIPHRYDIPIPAGMTFPFHLVWHSHSIWYDIPIPHRYDISIPPGMTFPYHLVWHSHTT